VSEKPSFYDDEDEFPLKKNADSNNNEDELQ